MFTPRDLQLERGWPGIIEGDTVVQLAAQTLPAFFTGGGRARRHAEYRLTDVDLRPPVLHPPAVRDLQRAEMKVGLGPAKGKDFATSLGPLLVTPDEFDGSTGAMIARVNGE